MLGPAAWLPTAPASIGYTCTIVKFLRVGRRLGDPQGTTGDLRGPQGTTGDLRGPPRMSGDRPSTYLDCARKCGSSRPCTSRTRPSFRTACAAVAGAASCGGTWSPRRLCSASTGPLSQVAPFSPLLTSSAFAKGFFNLKLLTQISLLNI